MKDSIIYCPHDGTLLRGQAGHDELTGTSIGGRCRDFGMVRERGLAHIVMEFLRGVELRQQLARDKQLDFADAYRGCSASVTGGESRSGPACRPAPLPRPPLTEGLLVPQKLLAFVARRHIIARDRLNQERQQ